MIRESLYFSFAGRKSTDFPIVNVNIGSGLYEESLTSNKTIVETKVPGNDIPYFIRTDREPKQFSLRFAFLEPWNDEMIDEIIRWLDVDFYEPLFFDANIDRLVYAMPVNTIDQIHNGLKQGYVNLTIRCNGAFSYSHEIITPFFEIGSEKIIEIKNSGNVTTLPEIWIEKDGDGDFIIENHSNNGEQFHFSNLKHGEKLYVDCLGKRIDTNLKDTYRYDDFNENYLELVYGINRLRVIGSSKIAFRYRYVYK